LSSHHNPAFSGGVVVCARATLPNRRLARASPALQSARVISTQWHTRIRNDTHLYIQ
jgi:hypothetical protein